MKKSKHVKSASITVIILGILTIANFIGIFVLIGGIIGLIDSEKKK